MEIIWGVDLCQPIQIHKKENSQSGSDGRDEADNICIIISL
jgi:hypothetical protein